MDTLYRKIKKYITGIPTQGGFTLLETLVAIFILVLALNALLTLTTDSLFTSNYAKNESTAVYLAQEAMDYIKNDKDTTATLNNDWISFLNHYGTYPTAGAPTTAKTVCYSADGCILDATNWQPTNSIVTCEGGIATFGTITCPELYFHETPVAGEYYNYDTASAIPSGFKRKVALSLSGGTDNTDELQVVVTVEWQNGTVLKSYVLRSSLLVW